MPVTHWSLVYSMKLKKSVNAAKKQRMKVAIVGGAQIMDQKGFFNIGKRNHMAVRKIFWKNNVIPDYGDVGGNVNRTVRLSIKDGNILIKASGGGEKFI